MSELTPSSTTHAGPGPGNPGLLEAARTILPDIVDTRRRLHRHPEVGLQLPWTQEAVLDELGRIGLVGESGRSVTSATAVIEGARPGPTVLLRADMDGLPLSEATGLSFASEIDGTMHACGHDTHLAMLLGAARLLQERRDGLAGKVLLMFQPGEEGWHGARYMLEDGLLERTGERPKAAFALHISTKYEAGTINVRPGAIYAAADFIRITVRGRGGHASEPHMALDPIAVAAEIILALQAMVGRRVDVFDPAVVTIAHVEAGTTTNIIPETAFLEGTIRTVSDATRDAVHAHVRRVVEGVCAAHGATADPFEIESGYPVTINDAGYVELLDDLTRSTIGEGAFRALHAPVMGAEDFSYVLQRVPGVMAFVGACPRDLDPATAPQNHSNRVLFDEPSMAVGAAMHAAFALRVLDH